MIKLLMLPIPVRFSTHKFKFSEKVSYIPRNFRCNFRSSVSKNLRHETHNDRI